MDFAFHVEAALREIILSSVVGSQDIIIISIAL